LRDTALFLGGQLTAQLGTSISSYAVIWYITLKTGSGAQYSLLIIASQLTMGIMAIFGGVWSDRYWRKLLIIGADGMTSLATLLLALYFLRGHDTLWMIVLLLAFRGLMSGVRNPAVTSSLPQLVPKRSLLRVNSLNSAAQSVISLGSPAIAAVLLTAVPLGLIFLVDAITSALAVGLILLVHLPRLGVTATGVVPLEDATGGASQVRSYGHEIGEALRTLRGHAALLRVTIVMAFMVCVVVPVAQMTPVFIARYFGTEQWKLAAGEICWSAGMVAGGLIMVAWGGMRNRMTLIMVIAVSWVVFAAGMGASPTLLVFCVDMVLWGASLSMLNASIITSAQEQIATGMLGRVMGLFSLILNLSGPIGMAAFGPLSDVISLRYLCLAVAAIAAVFLLVLRLAGGPGKPLLAPSVSLPSDGLGV